MDETTITPGTTETPAIPWRRIGIVVLVVLALVAGFFAIRALNGYWPASDKSNASFITAEELEAKHGLAVHLIGVTAAGGMIDFRMKIMDAEKAQSFLEDPANLPRLIVAESGLELMTPEGLDDDIEWLDGGILFNFYPNDGNAIEPGTPVIVQFGNVHLEPLPAQ